MSQNNFPEGWDESRVRKVGRRRSRRCILRNGHERPSRSCFAGSGINRQAPRLTRRRICAQASAAPRLRPFPLNFEAEFVGLLLTHSNICRELGRNRFNSYERPRMSIRRDRVHRPRNTPHSIRVAPAEKYCPSLQPLSQLDKSRQPERRSPP